MKKGEATTVLRRKDRRSVITGSFYSFRRKDFSACPHADAWRFRVDAAKAGVIERETYNGKIFCQSEDGKTYVLAASETFESVRVNSLDEMSLATPTIVGERLLIRAEGHLYSIRRPR